MALDTVANRRWRYIDNLVTKAEQATTKADKKSAKKIAEEAIKKGEGTELHNNVKAQKFRSRLDMIQILDESTGGSNVGKGKGTTVSAKQYQIQICSVLLKSDIDYKWNNNPDLKSYQNNTTLNGQYFYYCLASSSDGGHTWKRCGFSEADPLITVTNAELKMHSEFDGGYKIVKQTGTLTIKNGSDKFTITITNE